MAQADPVRLFISHHSSKYDVAQQVEALLAKRGIRSWIAPRDVPPGAPFDKAVHEAIEASSAILLLFCSNSDKSRHVKRELILGDSAGRPIIPLRLEAIDPGELAYHLADSQWIDWIDRREAVMDRVAAQIRLYAKAPADLAQDVTTLGSDIASQPAQPAPSQPAPSQPPWLVPALAAGLVAALIALGVFLYGGGAGESGDPGETIASVSDTAGDPAEPAEETSAGPDGAPSSDDPQDTPTPAPSRPLSPAQNLAAPDVVAPPRPRPQPAPAVQRAPVAAAPSASDQPIVRVIDACRGAGSDAEYLICSDPAFDARARQMGGLIGEIRSAYEAAGESPREFNNEQRAWMNGLKASCRTAACVEARQNQRLGELRDILASLQ